MDSERHCLVQDAVGDWFVIPVDYLEAWNDWLELPIGNESSWDLPDFVVFDVYSPSSLTFSYPQRDI